MLDPSLYTATTVEDKILMVPHIADVSNVIWYNVDMLAEHDITPPETWEDLLAACVGGKSGSAHGVTQG